MNITDVDVQWVRLFTRTLSHAERPINNNCYWHSRRRRHRCSGMSFRMLCVTHICIFPSSDGSRRISSVLFDTQQYGCVVRWCFHPRFCHAGSEDNRNDMVESTNLYKYTHRRELLLSAFCADIRRIRFWFPHHIHTLTSHRHTSTAMCLRSDALAYVAVCAYIKGNRCAAHASTRQEQYVCWTHIFLGSSVCESKTSGTSIKIDDGPDHRFLLFSLHHFFFLSFSQFFPRIQRRKDWKLNWNIGARAKF